MAILIQINLVVLQSALPVRLFEVELGVYGRVVVWEGEASGVLTAIAIEYLFIYFNMAIFVLEGLGYECLGVDTSSSDVGSRGLALLA